MTGRENDPAFHYFPTNYRWSMGVRAQNLIRVDLVTESPTVGRDGPTTTILVEPAWLALQVQEQPCG
ncbi:MAG: hypothetical protein AB7S93_22780 [Xanthobacteraceae bacterium]